MKIDRVVIDCPRRPWFGQIDADTRNGKRQLLDTSDEPDEARVFSRIATVGDASCAGFSPSRDCPRFVHDESPVEPIIRAALSGILSSMRCVRPRMSRARRPSTAHGRIEADARRKTQPTTHTENRK
ncbi:hypothetical protein [Burkholderia multivorans]|uniref:hypothetical protein n=1 Tax=Burkholderia multivorans TaxID=87883 RepID=UPI000AF6B676|nr:hypothetical protein [Burkholderia multivorans]